MIKKILIWLLRNCLSDSCFFPPRRSRRGKFIASEDCPGAYLAPHSASTHYDESCASSVMSRVRTSLSSFATRKRNPSGSAALADELVRLKVDLIIAGGPNDGLTAKKATKTIPIVFTDSVSDPVARGLVDSLARPGGNVTGFFTMADVLAGKRLQLLKECHSQTLARRGLVVPKVWE